MKVSEKGLFDLDALELLELKYKVLENRCNLIELKLELEKWIIGDEGGMASRIRKRRHNNKIKIRI